MLNHACLIHPMFLLRASPVRFMRLGEHKWKDLHQIPGGLLGNCIVRFYL